MVQEKQTFQDNMSLKKSLLDIYVSVTAKMLIGSSESIIESALLCMRSTILEILLHLDIKNLMN